MKPLSHPRRVPFMVYADADGNIFEDERYEAVGRSGYDVYPLAPEDFIELPTGSDLFTLPGRRPYGLNLETGEFDVCEEVQAVAALNALLDLVLDVRPVRRLRSDEDDGHGGADELLVDPFLDFGRSSEPHFLPLSRIPEACRLTVFSDP